MKTPSKFLLLKATCLLANLAFFLIASLIWVNSHKAREESQLKTSIVKSELNETCNDAVFVKDGHKSDKAK